MRALVTGGAGFIGSHLVDRLVATGVAVDAIDDLSGASAFDDGRRDRPGVTRHRFEVGAQGSDLVDLTAAADLVFHLASPIGVGLTHRHPDRVRASILRAGRAVVEACAASGTPLVYTSSSEAYGAQRTPILAEDLRPHFTAASRWAYGRAKLAVESMATRAAASGLRVSIARLFNVVGAGQRPATGLVLPSFCQSSLEGRPIVVHGDGSALRSFVDVRDVVDGLIRLAHQPALSGRPVNIGGTRTLRVDELAHHVCSLVGSVPIVRVDPSKHFGRRFAEVPARVPDLRLARKHLHWDPEVDIAESILSCAETIARATTERAS